MVGEVFGENALAAALAGLGMGLPGEAVARGISACPVVPGRFEVLDHGEDRATVAVDYAHSPDALAHTCATARRLAGDRGRVIVVFGSGGGGTADKRRAMSEAVAGAADLAIVTSDNPRDEDPAAIAATLAEALRGGRVHVEIELERAAAIARAIGQARAGDVVVVAGKGHEQGQVVRGQTRPFSDVEVVRACLRGS
jgi:UDP-N-acetylmuramoyl-L-alanyl-D-glutamate--2,6-diaminopimelate ligase